MKSIKNLFLILIFPLITCCVCDPDPPTEYAKQLQLQVENYKQGAGVYPKTIKGNLNNGNIDKIKTNDFFYIVDSTGTSFTLKVFNVDGHSDIYDSKTKLWIHTDK